MNIDKILWNEELVEDDFDYKKLFNDSRGALNKDIYKSLLKWSIKERVVTVKRYVVQENIDPFLFYDISDKKGSGFVHLKEGLKDYCQESDVSIAPFIHLLELLEGDLVLNESRVNYDDPIVLFPSKVIVGHKLDGLNSFSRLYFEEIKTGINSSNDNIETLIETLALDGLDIFVLDVENVSQNNQRLVLYKLDKNDKFNALKLKAQNKFLDEVLQYSQ